MKGAHTVRYAVRLCPRPVAVEVYDDGDKFAVRLVDGLEFVGRWEIVEMFNSREIAEQCAARLCQIDDARVDAIRSITAAYDAYATREVARLKQEDSE